MKKRKCKYSLARLDRRSRLLVPVGCATTITAARRLAKRKGWFLDVAKITPSGNAGMLVGVARPDGSWSRV